MARLHILKAQYGDAFILEVKCDDKYFVMVIDGGPLIAQRNVIPQIEALDKIDMLVLTHFDSDHVGGLAEFLYNNSDKAEKIGKYWLNLPQYVRIPTKDAEASYTDANNLKKFMENLEANSGKSIDWKDDVTAGMIYEDPNKLVKISILSPTMEDKNKNEQIFQRKITESPKDIESADVKSNIEETPLEDLFQKEYNDYEAKNRASMALLVECCDGTKYLLAGDAPHDTIVNSLEVLGFSEDHPLHVDVFKLPHHGSKKNISQKLLSLVECDKYLITTNGGVGRTKHPSRETIAKLIFNSKRDKSKDITICLNYDYATIYKTNHFISPEEIGNPDYKIIVEDNVEWL